MVCFSWKLKFTFSFQYLLFSRPQFRTGIRFISLSSVRELKSCPSLLVSTQMAPSRPPCMKWPSPYGASLLFTVPVSTWHLLAEAPGKQAFVFVSRRGVPRAWDTAASGRHSGTPCLLNALNRPLGRSAYMLALCRGPGRSRGHTPVRERAGGKGGPVRGTSSAVATGAFSPGKGGGVRTRGRLSRVSRDEGEGQRARERLLGRGFNAHKTLRPGSVRCAPGGTSQTRGPCLSCIRACA